MHLKYAPRHVIDIATQRLLHHGEGNLTPGNRSEGEQLYVEAFFTHTEIQRTHRPSEHQIGLTDVWKTQNRK